MDDDMNKNIRDFLPTRIKTDEYSMVQGRIPKEIFVQVQKIMHKEKLSWAEVMTACLRTFIAEMESRKK